MKPIGYFNGFFDIRTPSSSHLPKCTNLKSSSIRALIDDGPFSGLLRNKKNINITVPESIQLGITTPSRTKETPKDHKMSSAAASSGEVVTKTFADLSDKLEKSACYARNEHSGFPWTNLMIGDTRLGCKSDADEQLILHFEFIDFVKVHSIKFTEFNNGADPEQNPTRE